MEGPKSVTVKKDAETVPIAPTLAIPAPATNQLHRPFYPPDSAKPLLNPSPTDTMSANKMMGVVLCHYVLGDLLGSSWELEDS